MRRFILVFAAFVIGEVKVVDGALRVSGTIDGSLAYAWYGAMWSPADMPMQPADLSSKNGIHFRAKGDGKSYRLMVFARSKGMMPLIRNFVAGPEWQEHAVAWKDLGTDGKDVMAVIFAGGPAAGPFAFEIDDVALR